MLEYVYSLFIWPFHACMELFFVLLIKVLNNNAELSIVISAIMMNLFLMPFYQIHTSNPSFESHSLSKNRFFFAVIKPYLFILFYVVLFIASNNFYANIHFENLSFGLIRQDEILGINLNPVMVLIFSIIAIILIPFVKTKRIALPAIGFMAFFLLVCILLFNASLALSLFWAASASFLCIKNVFDSMKKPSKWYRGIILLACFVFLVFIIFQFKDHKLINSVILFGLGLIIALITIFITSIRQFLEKSVFYSADNYGVSLYRYSCIVLFLLLGLVIPLLLFASSPLEFPSLWTMLAHNICQASSICFIAAFFYWEFSSKIIHRFLIIFLPFMIILFLGSCFAVPGNLGLITSNFVFENWERSNNLIELGKSVLIVLVSTLMVFCVFHFKKLPLLKNGFFVIAASLAVIAGINIFSIIKQVSLVKDVSIVKDINDTQIYTFSQSGENVFILFLDMAAGFPMPDALTLDPTLEQSLDGFTWYPNTVTLGDCTIVSYPAMMGGYEYSPLELNKRDDETLEDKVNEAIKVLPKIFADAGYNVMITDPAYANLSLIPDPSIFDGMRNVQSRNINGIFSARYNATQDSEGSVFYNDFNYDIIIRFALFRMLPPIARPVFYNDGNWFKNSWASSYAELLDVFPNLLYLEDLCNVISDGNTLNIMMNETVHREGAHNRNLELVSTPIVFSQEELKEYGSIKNAVEYTYTFSAALSSVGKWCEWLKQEGVYDNTKIIVVADHGKSLKGTVLTSDIAERRNPLLLVKDFNSRGKMAISNEFMTNADMPTIATSSLTKNSLGKVANPFTGNEISSDAKNEEILIVDGPWQPQDHNANTFVINNIWELNNQNIFDAENWVELGKPE